jgi:sorting nexin-25
MESSVESLSNLPVNGTGGSPRKLTTVPEQVTASDKEPKGLAATRSTEYAELTPITIPIFDFMIELFDLHHENNWPRKALIDAVQRLLGGRIERWHALKFLIDFRIVRDQVGKYLVEHYIVQMVKQVQDAIWPEGVLRKSPPARTAKEKAKTKRDAGYKLASIFEGSRTPNKF